MLISANPTHVSDKGLQFTTDCEGLRLEAYQDTGGVWTIGVGHTGPEVVKGLKWTVEQAKEWLAKDMWEAEYEVINKVIVPLTQGQFDALCDFVFNDGDNRFETSTLLKKLNTGDYAGAANEFKRWVYDNGKIQPGLVKRAMGRKELFNS
jgi:lysozyme